MSKGPLRVGVIGAGHFGRYHVLKLAASARATLVGVNDHDPVRAARVAAEAGSAAMGFADLLCVCDAVVVAVPAGAHHIVAAPALRAGCHVLVEKPIATSLPDADDLTRLAEERGLVLQVGHLERFSAAHGAIRERAGSPLYIEASRVGTFKQRGTDVSVVLDLMIHDLDLALELVQSPITAVEAVGAAVASPRYDMVSARLRFASGAVATIAASRVAPRVERKMRIFGAQGAVSVDFVGRTVSLVTRGRGEPIPAGPPGFGVESASWQERDALEAEQAAFISAVLDGTPVIADAASGRRALDAALRVEAAVAESEARMRASGLLHELDHGVGGGF